MPSDTVKLSYFLEAIPNLEKVNTIHAFAVVESTRGWQGGGGGLTNLYGAGGILYIDLNREGLLAGLKLQTRDQASYS